MSSIQLFSYGSYIRITTDSSVLLLAKKQIKTIEVIRSDTVKLSIGEGTLNEILIKLSDVTQPAGLTDVAALRDAIAHMLDEPDSYQIEALSKEQAQIDELIAIRQLFNMLNGSFQIDLNFQQLQVNALISIGNRLLEAKEGMETLIAAEVDQSREMIAQTTILGSVETGVLGVQSSVGDLNVQMQSNTNTLGQVNTTINSSNNLLSSIEEKMQVMTSVDNQLGFISSSSSTTSSLMQTVVDQGIIHGNMLSTLVDIRNQNVALHTKQDMQITKLDAQISLLTSLVTLMTPAP